MLKFLLTNKKQFIIFSVIIITVSSFFALLGVKAASIRSFADKTIVDKVVYSSQKTKKNTTAKITPKKPDYILEATAYSDRGETKSRIHAGIGSVAVDKRIIPHGTLLYIEGYGLALATDKILSTGGKYVKYDQ